MSVTRFIFDHAADGTPVEGVTLTSPAGVSATLIAHGARLVRLLAPDRAGTLADVVLGFDRLSDYLESNAYFGATCGRYGNRIGGAAFTLDGVRHALSVNEPPNHLHGGADGFDRRLWAMAVEEAENAVTFTLRSPDGDQGYPGELLAQTRYRLTADGTLDIQMTAATDAPTMVNLVHHSYWNLAGHAAGDVRDHRLTVLGGAITPVDDGLIPTGARLPVDGTPFDLRGDPLLADALDALSGAAGGGTVEGGTTGFDHNWCLDGGTGDLRPGDLRLVARLDHPPTGRRLEVLTDQPGLQVYTGGYLSAAIIGKDGQPYRPFAGIALETQRFPNSPNIGDFPSARLDPGQPYEHRMELRVTAGA